MMTSKVRRRARKPQSAITWTQPFLIFLLCLASYAAVAVLSVVSDASGKMLMVQQAGRREKRTCQFNFIAFTQLALFASHVPPAESPGRGLRHSPRLAQLR